MASKTNCIKNGKAYYRIRRKVGKKLNEKGVWVDNYKDFYGKNKSDAEQQYNDFIKKQSFGLSGKVYYFGALADEFIKNVFLPDESFSAGTKENYLRAWNNYFKPSKLAGLPLDQIRSIDLQGFYNGLECSHGALKSMHNLMKLFFRYAEREGYCRDITTSIKIPDKNHNLTKESNITVWDDEEVKTILIGTSTHPLRCFIALALNTGLRVSELLGLKYSDIERDVLHVRRQLKYVAQYEEGNIKSKTFKLIPPKYNSVRDVPLNTQAKAALQEHMLKHKAEMLRFGYRTDFIFTTKSGGFIDRRNLSRSLDRFYSRIGVESKSIHTYRHTFASKLCAQGVPIQTASKLLGHSSVTVTAKYYVNVSHDEKLEAVEKLGF